MVDMMRWTDLSKPIFALAPMEDVTDTVFRRIIAGCAAPDVYFTEFTSVEGLCSAGRATVSQRLVFSDIERPIVAQIWGTTPQYFYQATQMLVAMGFDGIDINMGCPQRKITKQGGCAALINNPQLAKQIIASVKKGIADSNTTIPVSIKTRLGFKKLQTEEWISTLLESGIDALTIHGRTATEMSDAPVHWDEVGKIVELRNQMNTSTIILGNGDIRSRADGLQKINDYGLDGVMIGRGVFENLWIFQKSGVHHQPDKEEMLRLLLKHVQLFDEVWGTAKNFAILKRFFKIYTRGFPDATNLRTKLMAAKNAHDIYDLFSR